MLSTLAAITDVFSAHLNWWLFAAAIIAGVVVGRSDLLRLNFKRIWAISGVCFDESIRRRILWITPLAIIAVIIVSQLQRPIDEQDAIRQTTKFCLFATGFLVAVTTIILACTNLPREIENRVIYTVVTKPTTRLEIVLGKVLGFARVSLAILIIMGLFTYGYLSVRSWNMQRYISTRLAASQGGPASATLAHYRDSGLLGAKKLEEPDGLEVFARTPALKSAPDAPARNYFSGGGEGNVELAFEPTRAQLVPGNDPTGDPGSSGVLVLARVGYEQALKSPAAPAAGTSGTSPASGASAATQKSQFPAPAPASAPGLAPASAPSTAQAAKASTVPYYGPFIMAPEQRAAIMAGTKQTTNPQVSLDLFAADDTSLGSIKPIVPGGKFELTRSDGLTDLQGEIPPALVSKMLDARVSVRITGDTPNVDYYVQGIPIALMVPGPQPESFKPIPPAPGAQPIFQARTGTFGQQLKGEPEHGPVGMYEFRNANVDSSEAAVPFELRVGIERSGVENVEDSDEPTRLLIHVINLADGSTSDAIHVEPESNRPNFFNVPATALKGGNFNVLIRCLTPGHFVGLQKSSLSMVVDQQTFAWNLGKSLLILWLLSVLMTAVAIFTSTFLSWPIAVVLTLVILLGHWGVVQLGDAAAPGIGNQVVNDMGLKNAPTAKAVSATVEKLSGLLNFISAVLPDISRFPALEDIDRGVAIPPAKVLDAAAVTFGFGLPLVLLAYVFLKNKEVAP
jgi:ABC-type transport system involved in multi-copper enzyme maturation permease subunit